MLQWCFIYPITMDANDRVKMRQYLFLFLIPFIIYLSGFDLFSLSNFSKILLMDSLDILSLGTSSENYIRWYNFCVIKCTTICKEHLYGSFCKWRSGIKLSKVFVTIKYCKKNFPGEATLRKVPFTLFWFSLKEIVGLERSERKHLSSHRLLVNVFFGGISNVLLQHFHSQQWHVFSQETTVYLLDNAVVVWRKRGMLFWVCWFIAYIHPDFCTSFAYHYI